MVDDSFRIKTWITGKLDECRTQNNPAPFQKELQLEFDVLKGLVAEYYSKQAFLNMFNTAKKTKVAGKTFRSDNVIIIDLINARSAFRTKINSVAIKDDVRKELLSNLTDLINEIKKGATPNDEKLISICKKIESNILKLKLKTSILNMVPKKTKTNSAFQRKYRRNKL